MELSAFIREPEAFKTLSPRLEHEHLLISESGLFTSNQPMKPTAGRRTIEIHMISAHQSSATRALTRGSSSCSR